MLSVAQKPTSTPTSTPKSTPTPASSSTSTATSDGSDGSSDVHGQEEDDAEDRMPPKVRQEWIPRKLQAMSVGRKESSLSPAPDFLLELPVGVDGAARGGKVGLGIRFEDHQFQFYRRTFSFRRRP